jgi:5-formyltetrahydrofolate cyclo-ligase
VKRSLRKTIREKLAAISPIVAHAKSMAACKRLLAQPEFVRAETIMAYLPLPDEVDITCIYLRGWQMDKTIAAPKLSWDLRHMIPVKVTSLETGLTVGLRGLREPSNGQPIPLEMLDLVIVPALAFDRKGNRLGRGAGFYDRFLASPQYAGQTVGIAFQEQLVDELPTQENDVPVHVLVTDEEVLRFTPPARPK